MPVPPRATPVLRDFQAEDVERIVRARSRAIVASAPGTGKTPVSLSVLNHEHEQKTPALVVCPASVAENWKREARTWSPWAKVHVIEGETAPIPRADLYVCSWALLSAREKTLSRRGIRFVIADEAHFSKNETAVRSLSLAALSQSAPCLLLLTGTPVINRESELDALKSLFGSTPPLMIRRLLEDVAPEIPPKTRNTIPVQLSPRVAREYDRAEHEFEDWLADKLLAEGEIDVGGRLDSALASEALIKVGYLRRILARGKVPAVIDWTGRAVRLGEPVVIFAEHQEILRRVERGLRKLRIRCVVVDGSTPRKERQRAIDLFQAGKIPVFIGSKAAKEGITLTRARHLVFAERYWTSAEEEQAEDRVRRIGQLSQTRIWFPVVAGTIDDRMQEIIETKRTLVRDTIGSADILETDQDAVLRLLRAWNAKAGVRDPGQGEPLVGYGSQPLPRLPSPRIVCSLLFSHPRWINIQDALAWARLQGYHPVKVERAANAWRTWNHSPVHFERGSFRSIRLSADIRAIVGIRRSR